MPHCPVACNCCHKQRCCCQVMSWQALLYRASNSQFVEGSSLPAVHSKAGSMPKGTLKCNRCNNTDCAYSPAGRTQQPNCPVAAQNAPSSRAGRSAGAPATCRWCCGTLMRRLAAPSRQATTPPCYSRPHSCWLHQPVLESQLLTAHV